MWSSLGIAISDPKAKLRWEYQELPCDLLSYLAFAMTSRSRKPHFGIQLHRILCAGWDKLEDLDAYTDAVGLLHQRYEMTIHPKAYTSCQVYRTVT